MAGTIPIKIAIIIFNAVIRRIEHGYSRKVAFMGFIMDIVKEIPMSAILREKLKILDAENSRIVSENSRLKEKDAELNETIRQLEKKISDKAALEDQFMNKFGLKFKNIPGSSKHEPIPFCPKCVVALYVGSQNNMRTHKCSLCGFVSPLSVRALREKIKKDDDF